ncbi:hypothetical protein ABB27_09465 [Stenotrophomonas terrae]|uniref:Integral membrane protein n=1 Tax=Stenotrophomonas terrae TaxID=405446 RepID=A0A0R0CEP5_9GAMM|nr:RcnB family protein [Stenotrophomonas terrae]KRG67446.1 hypothetical protein ABB27_09465 [Stenotrophomonas terrae]
MKRIAATVLSLSLLASATAFAGPTQDRERDNTRHDEPQRSTAPHNQSPGNTGAVPAARNGAQHASQNSAHHAPRKGERLPQNQRGNRVTDYNKHGLRKPGRGNEWRKLDDRYVLMAVATGLIIDIVSGQR